MRWTGLNTSPPILPIPLVKELWRRKKERLTTAAAR
nr:MAG TPA: hypothetical protein [Caudoviricetes sp.]